jgi:hypothetical protein
MGIWARCFLGELMGKVESGEQGETREKLTRRPLWRIYIVSGRPWEVDPGGKISRG